MKLFNSRLATIAAAAAIVTFAGGTGAYASGLIDGGDIKNESITSVDIDNGTIRSADIVNGENGVQSVDIKDGSIRLDDLAPGISDTILENMKQGGMTDANGKQAYFFEGDPTAGMPAMQIVPNAVVTVTATSASTGADSKVSLTFGDHTATCVVVATDFGGSCSATVRTSGGNVDVSVLGAPVEVEVVGVQVG
jgi:hypothetical protein